MVVNVNETLDKTQSGWGNFQSKWDILRSYVQIYTIMNTNQKVLFNILFDSSKFARHRSLGS